MATMPITAEETQRILHERRFDCFNRFKEYLETAKDEPDDGKCGVAWDDITCWNATTPGTTAYITCPAFIEGFDPNKKAERYCTANGSWYERPDTNKSWTNYELCLADPVDISAHAAHADNLKRLYTVGYSVSLASLIVAVVIMLYWKRLHCKSNTLHINLFLAFIARASMAFMKDSLFEANLGLPHNVEKLDDGRQVFIQGGSVWECRMLYVLFMYAISATQTWILMEGLYLFLLIHKTIMTERLGVKPYIIAGWALPWTFLIPWIVVKSQFENTYCWNVQTNRAYFWIMEGPWLSIIVINFIFFVDIIRVLVIKARNNQRHAGRSQSKKFAKFILVLIPLFGIMYIVLYLAFPSEVRGDGYNVVYLYIEMLYNSFQGFILALLFCFLNEDVHNEIRQSWRQQRSRRLNHSIIKRSFARTSSWHKESTVSAHSPLNECRANTDLNAIQGQGRNTNSAGGSQYSNSSSNGFKSIYRDKTNPYVTYKDSLLPNSERSPSLVESKD